MKSTTFLALAALAVGAYDVRSAKSQLVFSEPILLEAPLNVPSSGTAGTTTFNNGLNVIFESHRPDGYGEGDLWEIRRASSDALWGEPVNLGANVNTEYWDAHPTVTSDGLHLVYCDFNPFGDPFRPGGYGASDLFTASRSSLDEPFGPASILPFPINSASYEALPGISKDGLALYISSNRLGGAGKTDLWVSTRQSITEPWGDPENLGDTISTSKSEEGPNLSADGLRLLFSSNRPGGNGSFDLWMSSRSTTDAPWQPPVHLGDAINSANFDNFPDVSDDFPAVGSIVRFSASNSTSANARWDVYESIVLAVPEPSADFDFDSDVDGGDFLYWQINDGSPAGLQLWQDQFGNVASSAAAASTGVPEPATGFMLMLGMVVMFANCRAAVSKLIS